MEYLKNEDELQYYGKRYELQKEIEDIFLGKGYSYIELPVVEYLDKFTSLYKNNKNIKKDSIVKLLNGSSDVLLLRPDNTISIIKSLIPRWEEDATIKLFYNSKVFRNDPNSNIREIRQLGIEYLGGVTLKSDEEVIGIALDILNKFNDDFILEISNSKYILGLFEAMDIKEFQKQIIKDFIYHKNRFELLDYLKKINIPKDIYDCLSNIFDLQGNVSKIIDKARNYYMNQIMEEALQELSILEDFINEDGYAKYAHFDLSMIMDLNYYDGVIFKGYYPNLYKDIVCGGRYDSFTEEFGSKVPAIGFSLDLDELTKIYCGKDSE